MLGLSRFTTTSGEKRSLKQYVGDLKPNQTEIYYLTGDSIERLLAMQNKAPTTRPILEINMRHPLVAAITGDKDAAKDLSKDLSFLLLEQAQILDGELPEDPAAFANRLNTLVLRGIVKG